MTKDNNASSPKWRRRADDRPDEVMDAALDLFIEKGFAATRVQDIAHRAGLSKGALYLYFDSKEAIFKALVRRAIVPMVEDGESMAKHTSDTPEQTVRLMMRVVARRLCDKRVAALPRLVITEAGNFPEIADMYREEVIERGFVVLGHIIERGVRLGVFRPVDSKLAVRNIVGPILAHSLLSSVFKIGSTDFVAIDEFVDSHLDILFNGLLAEREGDRNG